MKPALTATFSEIDLASLYSFPIGMVIIELAQTEKDKKNATKHLKEAKEHLVRVLDSVPQLLPSEVLDAPVVYPTQPHYPIVLAIVPQCGWLRALIKIHAGGVLSSLGSIRKADAMEVLLAIDSALKE